MLIKKIYNNNIAMVINEKGDEVILVGKGIVFGMKKGDGAWCPSPARLLFGDSVKGYAVLA